MALIFNQPERDLDVRGTITLTTGAEVSLSPTNVVSYRIDENSASSGFALGEAQSATYSIEIDNTDHDLTALQLSGAKVVMEVGIHNGESIQYVPFGVWYITSPQLSDQSAVALLDGCDALEVRFNDVFSDAKGNYPRTIGSLLTQICSLAGVELASSTFLNSTVSIGKLPEWPKDTTLRGVVAYVAAVAGGFARITRDGKLEIVSYGVKTSVGTVTADTYRSMETGDGAQFKFNCLGVKYLKAEEYTRYAVADKVDTASNTLQVDGNPLYTETIAQVVKSALTGFESEGISIDWIGDPTLRLGDMVSVEGVDGKVYPVVVNHQSISYDGGVSATTESALATETGSSSGYVSNEPAINAAGMVNGGKIVARSVSAEKIAAESITAEEIAAGAITTEKVSAGAISADKLGAGSVTADKVKAGALDAMTITAVTGAFNDLTVNDTLYAAFANVIKLAADSIAAGNITTDQLATNLAEVITLHAGTGEFDLATIQNLLSNALVLQQGQAGSMNIINLAVTSANLLNATIGELVLKGSDGLYYRVYIGSDGTIHTQAVTVSQGEIEAGQTSAGSQIVETTANIRDLNTQNIKGESAIIDSIVTTALTAGKITATEALIASATIPTLYTTAIKAIGDGIDLSANKYIQFVVGEVNKKSETYRQEDAPEDAEYGDMWVQPSTGYTYQLSGDDIPDNIMPSISIDEAGNMVYEFSDDQAAFELSINDDGDLVYADTTYMLQINDDGVLVPSGQWVRVVDNDAYDQISGLRQSALSKEEFQYYMRFDTENALVIGRSDSPSKAILNNEGLSVNVNGSTFSKFASNYAQFGKWQMRLSAKGALIFKLARE